VKSRDLPAQYPEFMFEIFPYLEKFHMFETREERLVMLGKRILDNDDIAVEPPVVFQE
jgi:hypothetical protein